MISRKFMWAIQTSVGSIRHFEDRKYDCIRKYMGVDDVSAKWEADSKLLREARKKMAHRGVKLVKLYLEWES